MPEGDAVARSHKLSIASFPSIARHKYSSNLPVAASSIDRDVDVCQFSSTSWLPEISACRGNTVISIDGSRKEKERIDEKFA